MTCMLLLIDNDQKAMINRRWQRNETSWLSHDASVMPSSSSFDTNNNGTNESKIVHMVLSNNSICVNITNNNDIVVEP